MSEINEINRDGAKPQPNSGRGQHAKGDATLGPFLIDYKEYTESFGVSRKVWGKLTMDAFRAGRRIPALKLVLGDPDTKDKVRLWVVPDDMFHEMLEAWNEANDE